ncbi:MAG: glycosyltransferase [Anaerolineae bacterium]
MNLLTLLLSLIYLLCAILLAAYAGSTLVLVALYLYHRKNPRSDMPARPVRWPTVVVQLPIYNEANVVRRLIDAVAALDYPRDRLSIQVLDDSTDHTSGLVQARVEHYRAAGLDMQHLRRPDRRGFKAGALAYGLENTQAEVIAVFDADFIPPVDFLRQTVPYIVADPQVGIVQARWGHLNARENLLTRAQALAIDTHFAIEQAARSSARLPLSFGGSAGIWRRACVEDAGGWRDDTLTEDLDLSYRAQIRGWRCVFLPHVEVPGEIPPQIAAYKRQQARWAKGTTQCLIAHGPRLFRSRLGFVPALMGLAHLCQYLMQPCVLMLLVLTLPLMLSGALQQLNLSFLGVMGIVPLVAFTLGQQALYANWPVRMLILPLVVFLSAGVTFNNTAAVLAAVSGQPNEFRRTPKFGAHQWQSSRYALLADWTVLGELGVTLYATLGAFVALKQRNVAALSFFVFYALAAGAMVVSTLLDARRITRWALDKRQRTRAGFMDR